MEPPNKGHVGDNINSAVLYSVEVVLFQRFQYVLEVYGKQFLGTSTCVLHKEVYYTVPILEGPLSECTMVQVFVRRVIMLTSLLSWAIPTAPWAVVVHSNVASKLKL